MNGLRTYHRTLWKKSTDAGAIDEHTPCWQHYDQLMFLNDHFQPRETMAHMSKRKFNMDERETTENNHVDDDSDEDTQPEYEYTVRTVNNSVPLTKSRRMLTQNHDDEVIVKNVECASTTCSKKRKCPEMLFGELVGHSLINIKDERTREYAKLQIQQILFKCRYPETVEEIHYPLDYTSKD